MSPIPSSMLTRESPGPSSQRTLLPRNMASGTFEGSVGIMPLYASFLTGDVHSLYLAAGGALLGGAGPVHDYESTWIVQGSLGYRSSPRAASSCARCSPSTRRRPGAAEAFSSGRR